MCLRCFVARRYTFERWCNRNREYQFPFEIKIHCYNQTSHFSNQPNSCDLISFDSLLATLVTSSAPSLITFLRNSFVTSQYLSVSCECMSSNVVLIAHISSICLHESTFHSISSRKCLFNFFHFVSICYMFGANTFSIFSLQQVQNIILSVENKFKTRIFQCLRAFVCVHKLNGF